MDSQLSPEAYRQLLDAADRDEDSDLGVPPARRRQQHQQLLSLFDWDALDDAGAARLLDQYARAGAASTSRKRQLCKSAAQHSAVLPPLPSPAPQHHMPDHLQLSSALFVDSNTREGDTDGGCGASRQPSSPQRRQAASPSKLGKLPTSDRLVLPPLDTRVLHRKRVFLSATGAATIGVEEIVQLYERISPPQPRSSPLQLTALPKKCTAGDEVALMPCHSLQYRYVPRLSAECWREPMRDRGKNWSADELNVILALHRASDQAKCAMTNPLHQRKGKWRHWEAMRLHIHGTAAREAATPQRDPGLPQQILIRNQGAMISSTYCVVSVFGVGVYGRIYSPSLAERHGTSRYLRFEAYDPQTSRRFEITVTMRDLERVFESRQELLVAGKKRAIIKELIALLFFRYPSSDDLDEDAIDKDNINDNGDANSSPNEPQDRDGQPERQHAEFADATDEQLRQSSGTRHQFPVLCISSDKKLSDAARRRREREERLRLAEEERLRALALLLKLPRRARHRLLCQSVRVSGHKLIVSLYHSPAQIRSFAIVAYHPPSSRSFLLVVGVMEAASLSRIFTLPHRWSPEQKLLVAQALIPRLRFKGVRTESRTSASTEDPGSPASDYASYRLSLAIRDDRFGAPSEWLALPHARTSDELRDKILHKYQVDGQRALKATFDARMQILDAESDAKAAEINTQIDAAGTRKVELRARDAELQELIEEINSGNGAALAATMTTQTPSGAASAGEERSPQELRRDYKAERQRVKAELKTLSEHVGAWKRELAAARETQTQVHERAAKALERATRDLESEALISTRGLYEVDPTSVQGSMPRRGQRTWLARPHIMATMTLVASGACTIAGTRYRCSVFRAAGSALSPIAVDSELFGVDSSRSSSSDASRQDSPSCDAMMFSLLLYDPVSSSTWTLELAQLDWISYTKQHHDAQLLVPQFGIATSPVTERLRDLHAALAASREALAKTYATKRKKNAGAATASKKVAKLRAQLCSEMTRYYVELRSLYSAAPWHRMITAIGERIRFPTADSVAVDPCIFRATLPIVSIAGGDDEEGTASKGDDDMVYYDVRVLQQRHEVEFVVVDPSTRCELSLVYPDSAELVKEFAVETLMEQQMHLEAIAMTLLFFVDESTGKRGIRFED